MLFNYDVSEKVSRRVLEAVFHISLLVLGAKYDNLGVAIGIERKLAAISMGKGATDQRDQEAHSIFKAYHTAEASREQKD